MSETDDIKFNLFKVKVGIENELVESMVECINLKKQIEHNEYIISALNANIFLLTEQVEEGFDIKVERSLNNELVMYISRGNFSARCIIEKINTFKSKCTNCGIEDDIMKSCCGINYCLFCYINCFVVINSDVDVQKNCWICGSDFSIFNKNN